MINLLSCQPRVTLTSCSVYKVIRDLESIDHLFINPTHRIGSILKRPFDSGKLKLVYTILSYLAIVNKLNVTVTSGWHYSTYDGYLYQRNGNFYSVVYCRRNQNLAGMAVRSLNLIRPS